MYRALVHLLPGFLIAIAAVFFSQISFPSPAYRLAHLGFYLFGAFVFLCSLYLETLDWSSFGEVAEWNTLKLSPRQSRLFMFAVQVWFLSASEAGNLLFMAFSEKEISETSPRNWVVPAVLGFLAAHFVAEFFIVRRAASKAAAG